MGIVAAEMGPVRSAFVMCAGDLAEPGPTVGPEATGGEVLAILKRSPLTSIVAVVDDDGAVLGALERDRLPPPSPSRSGTTSTIAARSGRSPTAGRCWSIAPSPGPDQAADRARISGCNPVRLPDRRGRPLRRLRRHGGSCWSSPSTRRSAA